MNRFVGAFLILPLIASACADTQGSSPSDPLPTDVDGIGVLRSKLAFDENPEVSEADLAAAVAAETAFAASLFSELTSTQPIENVFFSPHSIATALTMASAGARGETAAAMAATLHIGALGETIHPALNRLAQTLASREDVPTPDGGDPFALRIVNGVWGLEGASYGEAFLDTLSVHYNAPLFLVDFLRATEEARVTINAWVATATHDLIPELLAPGILSSSTRLVLTNAIYFHAGWLNKFDADQTAQAPFHNADGTSSDVDMMTLSGATLPYQEIEGTQIVELPYVGDELAMLIVLPPASGAGANPENPNDPAPPLLALFTPEALATWTDGLAPGRALLKLPRFAIDTQLSLKEALARLGMGIAFGEGADFSGIMTDEALAIADVVHQGVIQVDEEGTEAAGATAVVFGPTSVQDPPFTMTVDRPFFFVIRDRPTGAVLFVGQVNRL